MTVPVNNIATSGTAASGGTAAKAAAGSVGSAAKGKTSTSSFQDLLATLLDLLSAQAANAGGKANAGTANANIKTSASADQSSSTKLDLGGLLDLKTILDLKTMLADKAGKGDKTDGTSDTSATGPDGKTKTPDPLAAVLDLLISALKDAAKANPGNDPLSLDAKSRDTLKALNALLASLDTGKPTAGTTKQPTPLPPDVVDKLKTLDQLLSNQSGDPQLDELKTRVADLLGTNSASDTAKKTAPGTTAEAAPVAGPPGTPDKSGAPAQRDSSAQALDGAKASVHTTATQNGADSGNQAGQNQNQNKSQPAPPPPARQTQPATAAAAQAPADHKDASKQTDPATDPMAALGNQSANRVVQQTQLRALPAYNQHAQRLDTPQIAFEIARHAVAGINRFQIRLDPPEMGRIDVRLDISHTGGVTAHLTVDRPDTFDALQRDARMLERSLAQSGLDSGKTNLEFSLRQNPFARQDSGQGHRDQAPSWINEIEETSSTPSVTAPSPISLYRGSLRPGGVNLVA